jgi:BA14K-like protein
MTITSKLLAVTMLAAGVVLFAAPVNAAPITASSSLRAALAAPVETVQWRRGLGWRGGWGPGIAAGVVAGAAVAASQPWGYGYGYDNAYNNYNLYTGYNDYAYTPGYQPSYGYETVGVGAGGSVAYCQQRFRSYNPATGTYMGYDGMRHSCP